MGKPLNTVGNIFFSYTTLAFQIPSMKCKLFHHCYTQKGPTFCTFFEYKCFLFRQKISQKPSRRKKILLKPSIQTVASKKFQILDHKIAWKKFKMTFNVAERNYLQSFFKVHLVKKNVIKLTLFKYFYNININETCLSIKLYTRKYMLIKHITIPPSQPLS